MPEVETYSNPIAPPDQELPGTADVKRANLTNDDFRKLMMTPRPSASSSTSQSSGASAPKKITSSSKQHERQHRRSTDEEDEERRQKRKSYYAQLRKEEEERQEEWAKKYRDRARERRDGDNPDYEVSSDSLPATSGYRAVGPNLESSIVEERRKQLIQESKFLGGDMQHTHLVKGLDYVLLDKVRSEMQHKQREKEEISLLEKKKQREVAKKEFTDDLKFKTTLAKNVFRTLFLTKPAERNEFFTAGRMAYVFELDDEYAESDIPTTLLRSKADCPTQEVTTLSTNDIVINKLTQILSYLRQGARAGKKGKKKDKGLLPVPTGLKVKELPSFTPAASFSAAVPPKKKEEGIFSDVGQYVFDPSAATSSQATKGSYFDQPVREKEVTAKEIYSSAAEFVKAVGQRYGSKQMSEESSKPPGEGVTGGTAAAAMAGAAGGSGGTAKTPSGGGEGKQSSTAAGGKSGGGFGVPDMEGHYAECYPGGMEEYDATYDSDEDVDFSKMDMGNKKGPVKRWDFDNEEEYNTYQSSREALPRAAFQYGVKMSEGRKTRRFGGGVTGKAKEKAKLNREWQQISALLEKRKRTGGEGGSGSKRQKLD